MTDGPRIGALFAGYGGLERGVTAAFGGTVVWHSEIDPGASAILAHHYPDVPNLGDITMIDWSAVPPVDVLTGGFPCQDVSHAGLRAGMRPGTRSGLWSQMAYAIDQLRPGLVVIENVRGLLSAEAHSDLEPCQWCVGDDGGVPLRALGAVTGDLADIGYDARWVGLRAADVGAPHGRFRVFVVAWPAGDGALDDAQGADADSGRDGRAEVAARGSGRAAADTGGEAVGLRPGLRAGGPGRVGRGRPDDGGASDAAADTVGGGRHERRPEPAGQLGGSDAAVGGDAAADTGRDRRERVEAAHDDDRGDALGDLVDRRAAADAGDDQRAGRATVHAGRPAVRGEVESDAGRRDGDSAAAGRRRRPTGAGDTSTGRGTGATNYCCRGWRGRRPTGCCCRPRRPRGTGTRRSSTRTGRGADPGRR